MSRTNLFRILGTAIILFALTGPAAAGGHVDWSQYIDTSAPARTAPAAEAKPSKAPARAKKASRAKASKATARKAKATKARKKSRRK